MKLGQVFNGYDVGDEVTGALQLSNLSPTSLLERGIIRLSTKGVKTQRWGQDTTVVLECYRLNYRPWLGEARPRDPEEKRNHDHF